MGTHGLERSRPEQGLGVGCCEGSTEISGCIKGMVLLTTLRSVSFLRRTLFHGIT